MSHNSEVLISPRVTAQVMRLAAEYHPKESVDALMGRYELFVEHGGLDPEIIIEEIEAARAAKPHVEVCDPYKQQREEAERRRMQEEREREARAREEERWGHRR